MYLLNCFGYEILDSKHGAHCHSSATVRSNLPIVKSVIFVKYKQRVQTCNDTRHQIKTSGKRFIIQLLYVINKFISDRVSRFCITLAD